MTSSTADPKDNPSIVYDLDLFKVPAQCIDPAAAAAAPAYTGDPLLQIDPNQQHMVQLVQAEVFIAVEKGQPAGPFAAAGRTAVHQLVRGLKSARRDLWQHSSRHNRRKEPVKGFHDGSRGSDGAGDQLLDFCCPVAAVAATPDNVRGVSRSNSSSSGDASSRSNLHSRKKHRYVYYMSVYPCAWWLLVPRRDRVAAVAATAAAATA